MLTPQCERNSTHSLLLGRYAGQYQSHNTPGSLVGWWKPLHPPPTMAPSQGLFALRASVRRLFQSRGYQEVAFAFWW